MSNGCGECHGDPASWCGRCKTADSSSNTRGLTVLQPWVADRPFMQQSVLIAAVRGPDGIRKDHVVKVLCRWLRRSFMLCAFHKVVHLYPDEPCGGSFTGPMLPVLLDRDGNFLANRPRGVPHADYTVLERYDALDWYAHEYLRHVDELPHHFQLHLMHAAEILGYKHPRGIVRDWWLKFYLMIVNDAHLRPEPEEAMDKRLGDSEINWRAAEIVTAK